MLQHRDRRYRLSLHLSLRAAQRVWVGIFAFMLWAALVTFLEYEGLLPGRISPVPFTFIGLPLGFFLAFRGNQGYARYWEARQAWNLVGNCVRNFARQVDTYIHAAKPEDEAAVVAHKRALLTRSIAYVYALRASLSDEDAEVAAAKHLDFPIAELHAAGTNVAYAILQSISRELERGMRAGWSDRLFARHMDAQLALLNDAAGACEKLRDTPLPVPLVLITTRLVLLYLAGLPIGIVDVTEWFTPVVVGVLAFAFLGLSTTGGELSAPFRKGPNQLPLLTTARRLERDLRRILGDPLPSLPPVENGIVL